MWSLQRLFAFHCDGLAILTFLFQADEWILDIADVSIHQDRLCPSWFLLCCMRHLELHTEVKPVLAVFKSRLKTFQFGCLLPITRPPPVPLKLWFCGILEILLLFLFLFTYKCVQNWEWESFLEDMCRILELLYHYDILLSVTRSFVILLSIIVISGRAKQVFG